ncbi:MAG: hypothetical protein IPH55_11935 [Betaproteobacteria bacterium]|nr:hypothetical protein [Betaproteobacteria bacterium]
MPELSAVQPTNAFDQCFLADEEPMQQVLVHCLGVDTAIGFHRCERKQRAGNHRGRFAPVDRVIAAVIREQRKLPVPTNHQREIARAFTLIRLVGFMVGEEAPLPVENTKSPSGNSTYASWE